MSKAKVKREITLDPLSVAGEYLGEDDSSSSVSSFPSSIDDEEEPPQESMREKCERIQREYPDFETPANTVTINTKDPHVTLVMLDRLLVYVKLLVLIHFWGDSTLQNVEINDDFDDDEDIRIKLLYYRWNTAVSTTFRPMLEARASLRYDVFARDMLHAMPDGPDPDHPMCYVLQCLRNIRCVWGKRKLKRSPSAYSHYYDAWSAHRYNTADETRLVGDDPMRPKQISFYQRPSDLDPNAVDMEQMEENEYYTHCAKQINGETPTLLPPFKVAFPQFVHLQLMGLHTMLHFEDHVAQEVIEFLQANPLPLSEPPQSWGEAWGALCTERFSDATIHEMSKGVKFVELVARLRDVLRANLTMITCIVCRRHCNAQYRACPECTHTVYHCTQCGAPEAMTRHNKLVHKKK